jgi:hypothetical protein
MRGRRSDEWDRVHYKVHLSGLKPHPGFTEVDCGDNPTAWALKLRIDAAIAAVVAQWEKEREAGKIQLAEWHEAAQPDEAELRAAIERGEVSHQDGEAVERQAERELRGEEDAA